MGVGRLLFTATTVVAEVIAVFPCLLCATCLKVMLVLPTTAVVRIVTVSPNPNSRV